MELTVLKLKAHTHKKTKPIELMRNDKSQDNLKPPPPIKNSYLINIMMMLPVLQGVSLQDPVDT